jgi:hypothetical protein
MVDKLKTRESFRPRPRCPRAEPHLAFGPCDTPMQDMAAFFGKWTLSRCSDEGCAADGLSFEASVCSTRFAVVDSSTHAPACQPSAPTALRGLLMQNIRLALHCWMLGRSATLHLSLHHRGSQLSTSQSFPSRLRNFNHANRVRELVQHATGDLLHSNCVWLSRE